MVNTARRFRWSAQAVTVLLALALFRPAAGEVNTIVTVKAFNSVLFARGERTITSGFGIVELDLRNTGSADVRARVQLRGILLEADGGPSTEFSLPRAEVRWRLHIGEDYTMRLTAGRTRISWGDGQLYNAGDVINGVAPDEADLTEDILRDETQWMVSAWLPLGRFSFVEPVLLVPMAELGTAQSPEPGSAEQEAGAGFRVQAQLLDIKTEAGYLYRSETETHHPYVSLQGNLLLDWYLAASFQPPDPVEEELDLSGGVLYNGSTRSAGSWSVRGEFLWRQRDESLMLYPELTWSPSQLFSLFARGTVNPEEDRGDAATGVTWTPATGLGISLHCAGSIPVDSVAVTAGVSYVF